MTRKISLTVNGMQTSHEVEPRLLLVHYLRDVLGLTELISAATPVSVGRAR